MAQVRYLVDDVERAVMFYTLQLGFEVEKRYGDAMAIVANGDLKLWLAGPNSSAARAMADGAQPLPGGWNRIVLTVAGLDPVLKRFEQVGVELRNQVVSGPGGRQVLIQDPAGNLVELFEPS